MLFSHQHEQKTARPAPALTKAVPTLREPCDALPMLTKLHRS
jgi:hypothetical protein